MIKQSEFDPAPVDELVARVKKAQNLYASYTQEQVNAIFNAVAKACSNARIPLSKLAVKETGMGVLEDKVIKNHFAAEYIYNTYKNVQTCGILNEDDTNGFERIAEPLGVIAGVIPVTNPTSTTIFKALLALKTRNGIIFSPHPRAAKCTAAAAKIVLDAAVKAGAPKDIVGWLENPSMEGTSYLMKHKGIALILATGGPGMVKAAYSSGNPAIGVGAGNTPVVIDKSANIKMAVSSIIMSKTFDNGLICASEQAVIVEEEIAEAVRKEFKARGCVFLEEAEKQKLKKVLFLDGKLNSEIVGQPVTVIAKLAGIKVPATTKVLLVDTKVIDLSNPFSHEKLSPILAFYTCPDFETGVKMAQKLVELGGAGHTSVLYVDEQDTVKRDYFAKILTTARILVNMPSSQGAIGDVYNFKLAPSLTLGCGSWGGNSVSENIGVKHLMNIKSVAQRRENMLWFRVPPQIYFKLGATQLALRELKGKQRAFLVTDKTMVQLGHAAKVITTLKENGMDVRVFDSVKPDPDLADVHEALSLTKGYEPDVFVALGGGSPIDACKMIWLLYENPDVSFEDIAMRFMDIRKRIVSFPKMGRKALMVAIPTTSGTGSEVTPFTVITDEKTKQKYPITDYELTPDMAIIDPDYVMKMPKTLTAYAGLDVLTHAIEAYTSVYATNFSDGQATEAARLVYKYLKRSYQDGEKDPMAREKMHYAATMAGMAFANAFLGLCHSMAHKLGAMYHVPHGLANALLLPYIIRYNATDAPTKQGLMPQYKYPFVKGRYVKLVDFLRIGDDIPEKDVDAKVQRLIDSIEQLKADLEIPKSIKAFGIDEKEFLKNIDVLSEQAFDDQCTGGNARYPLISEIKDLYLKAYYGKPI